MKYAREMVAYVINLSLEQMAYMWSQVIKAVVLVNEIYLILQTIDSLQKRALIIEQQRPKCQLRTQSSKPYQADNKWQSFSLFFFTNYSFD